MDQESGAQDAERQQAGGRRMSQKNDPAGLGGAKEVINRNSSPVPKRLPAPKPTHAEKVFRSDLTMTLWQLKNGHPQAQADARAKLDDLGLSQRAAEEITRRSGGRRT